MADKANKTNDEQLDDKKIIQDFGYRMWEKACDDMETLLNTQNPLFFDRTDKRFTDAVAHIKNSSAAAIQTVNALEKASKLKQGILGKENLDEDDEAKRIEDLLDQVMKVQQARGKNK